MHSLKLCLESKQLPVLGLALNLSSFFFFALPLASTSLSHVKQYEMLKDLPLVSLHSQTENTLSFLVSCDLFLYFCATLCGILILNCTDSSSHLCPSMCQFTKGSIQYTMVQ